MIDCPDVPIVIVCKDRIRYLDTELKSLSATAPSSLQVYLSNDGSDDQRMLRYLTTQDCIPLDDEWLFPQDNREWDDLIGRLPNAETVRGIAGKVHVILHGVSAGTANLGRAVKYVFTQTGAPYVIKMEDDLLFTPGWHSSLVRAIQSSGCDLVSGFRYFYRKARMRPLTDDVEEVYAGFTGGPLMIASRAYYDACPRVFDNAITTIWDNDDLWINECRRQGMKFGVLAHSVCQHVGFHTEAKQRGFLEHGRLLKVDRLVRSTRVGHEVAQFGACNRLIDGSHLGSANE
jgi:hypothetical protein